MRSGRHDVTGRICFICYGDMWSRCDLVYIGIAGFFITSVGCRITHFEELGEGN